MKKLCLFVAFVSPLAGCAAGPTAYDKNYSANVSETVSPAMAMVLLPPQAGRTIAVIEKKHANAVEQTITLQNESAAFGTNKIMIKSILPGELIFNTRSEDVLDIKKPTEDTINDELETEFPNATLSVADVFDRNLYGPFGYALGVNSDKSHCIYAWQFIEGTQRNLLNYFETSVQPTSVRVRLCKLNATQAELISYIRQMRISSPGSYALYPVASLSATPTSNPSDFFAAANQPTLRPTTEPLLGAPLALASASSSSPARIIPARVKPKPIVRRKLITPKIEADNIESDAPVLVTTQKVSAPVNQPIVPLPSDVEISAHMVQPNANRVSDNQSASGIPLPQ